MLGLYDPSEAVVKWSLRNSILLIDLPFVSSVCYSVFSREGKRFDSSKRLSGSAKLDNKLSLHPCKMQVALRNDEV